jgi:hypothetical protein
VVAKLVASDVLPDSARCRDARRILGAKMAMTPEPKLKPSQIVEQYRAWVKANKAAVFGPHPTTTRGMKELMGR